ncbi:MAG TPA: hypothetical protein VFD50_03295 [Thermoleophilia bacterium]|nr:hypothetical protein [Thermoleophilia bacterium]
MANADVPAAFRGSPGPPRTQGESTVVPPRLELPDVASELRAIVGYIAAADGPLRLPLDPAGHVSRWHERLLLKAMERLEVIDAYLRGRVAFLAAGKEHGYAFFDTDLELARAELANCRATTRVVEGLLAGRLPTDQEFDSMDDTVAGIYRVLEQL